MAFSETLGPIGGILRVVAALAGRRPATPGKHLHARIVMRAVVSELPADIPIRIVDDAGRAHRGIYALNVLIWNKGSQEITPSDFLDNAPLRLAVDKESYIIMAESLTNDDQLACSALQIDEQTVDIYFDCINPGDYLNVNLFYGGRAMPTLISSDAFADRRRASIIRPTRSRRASANGSSTSASSCSS